MYRPINLREQNNPLAEIGQVKEFDDNAFRAIVKKVVANMQNKERRLTQI